MSVYQSLVDPTNFGTVVRHLHHPARQIHFVLHVRDESMLPALAAKLDAAMAGAQNTPVALGSILDPMFADGSLRISARHELPQNNRWPVIPVTHVPSLAGCQVIYLPPFYLAHTPGLFEGAFDKPEVLQQQGAGQRIKL